MRLKQLVQSVVPKQLHSFLINAYDLIGDIAVLNLPDQLLPFAAHIGAALLQDNPRIKTVALRQGEHAGEFRTRPLTIIAGEFCKETLHKEYGIRLRLNPEKVYFSPRGAEERRRIASQTTEHDHVCVLFSGIAPLLLMIASLGKAARIVGIEKNPIAHSYAAINARLNKQDSRIELHSGDVREILPGLKSNFTRIVMPLPTGADQFLPLALSSLRQSGSIHFYDFQDKAHHAESVAKIQHACIQCGRTLTQASIHCCGHCGQHIYRICVDAQID